MPGPVFEMPASPEGWEGSSTQLVRIVDPLGDAIAWLAPDSGGCCAGYAVRQGSNGARFPSIWHDIVLGTSANPSIVVLPDDVSEPRVPWRLVERDPASCTIDLTLETGSRAEHWQLTASLTDARLFLDLRFHNLGPTPVRIDAGMRLVLPSRPVIGNPPTGPFENNESAIFRDLAYTSLPQRDRIVLAVESDVATTTSRIEQMEDQIICTISNKEHGNLPIVEPGVQKRLALLIELSLAQPDHL